MNFDPPKTVETEPSDFYKEIDGHLYRLLYSDQNQQLEWVHLAPEHTTVLKHIDGKFRVVQMLGPLPKDNCMERRHA